MLGCNCRNQKNQMRSFSKLLSSLFAADKCKLFKGNNRKQEKHTPITTALNSWNVSPEEFSLENKTLDYCTIKGQAKEHRVSLCVCLFVCMYVTNSVNKLGGGWINVLTFSLGSLQNICCSDTSPEPPELLGCRNSVVETHKQTHTQINGASGQKGQGRQIKVC